MKKLIISVMLCVFSLSAAASQKAVTEQGNVVILNSDGTWQYEQETAFDSVEILVNSNPFTKDGTSTFAAKSTKINASFYINPKKWQFKKNDGDHDSAEYTFQLKGEDLYGLAITEKVEIEVEELVKLAFDNAKDAAPDMRVLKKEYRVVNGTKVIYMEMAGTIQSIEFKYLGYYHSNANGSTQYLAYTGVNLVDEYRAEIDKFLNGFSVAQ